MTDHSHIGSSLEDFLQEEGVLEEVTVLAVKRVLALQIEAAMDDQQLSRSKMAEQMGTSRAALNRLLDPTNPSVTLQTLAKAAKVIGKQLHISLSDTPATT